MTVPQPPNVAVQLTDTQGRATPYFLKLLGELCATAAGGLDSRVTALESSVATLTSNNATLGATQSAQGTTLAGHTTHLNALPTSRLSGSATYNPPNLIAGAITSTTVTVAGAVLGQDAECDFSLDTAGVWFYPYVSAASTVTVVLWNNTAGAVDLASGTLTAHVWTP